MRISDWSSDVCSSDLCCRGRAAGLALSSGNRRRPEWRQHIRRFCGALIHLFIMTPVAAGALLNRTDEIRALLCELMHPDSPVRVGPATEGSEERRVGKAWGSTCRSGWHPIH